MSLGSVFKKKMLILYIKKNTTKRRPNFDCVQYMFVWVILNVEIKQEKLNMQAIKLLNLQLL